MTLHVSDKKIDNALYIWLDKEILIIRKIIIRDSI